MTLTQLMVLAVLQAVTEVFPLSMEGHTALISHFLHWPEITPAVAASTRFGLAAAIVAYFGGDVGDMVVGVIRTAKGKRDPAARLAAQIVVASILTLGLGVAFQIYVLGDWNAPAVTGWTIIGWTITSWTTMGWTVIGVAVLLFFLDSMSMTVKRVEHATYLDAILISLGQVLALAPGAGGVAVMIIMARLLGYERQAAARFAFLLAVPVLTAVAVRDALAAHAVAASGPEVRDFISAGASFAAGLIALAILMSWLKRSTFMPFVVYRLLIGAAILAVGYEWIN